jgi:hypothetical protein
MIILLQPDTLQLVVLQSGILQFEVRQFSTLRLGALQLVVLQSGLLQFEVRQFGTLRLGALQLVVLQSGLLQFEVREFGAHRLITRFNGILSAQMAKLACNRCLWKGFGFLALVRRLRHVP